MKLLLALLLAAVAWPVAALDEMKVMQQQCVALGFKLKTPENGNCVLKLMKLNGGSTGPSGASASSAEERTRERQQQYAHDAEVAQKEREIQALRQQQQQMLELQRRSVAAQEKAADAQSTSSTIYGISNAIQMLNGTGAYAKPDSGLGPFGITCTTNGPFTNCR